MTSLRNHRTIARGPPRPRRRIMLPQSPSTSQKSPSRSGENRTCLLRSPFPPPNPETRSSTKGHRTLNSGFKRGILKTDTQRTVDRVAATQLIIDPPTLTLAKGVAVSSEVIHTNLRTIGTGSQVVHKGLPISPLAGTTIGHGLHLQIDPARLPPSTVYHHAQTSPRTTYGGRPGIGAETTILVTNLVTDTTVQTTCRRIVTTAPKEIRGGHPMTTGRGPLPLRLDPLEWIMLQLLALMMHRTVSTPLHRRLQTPLPHPPQNDPYLQSINRYPFPFLQRNHLLPSSADPLHRLIPLRPPKTSRKLNQALPISLSHHNRNVPNGRDALVKKRSWRTAARSRDAAQSTIMTLRPSWGKERLGKSPALV